MKRLVFSTQPWLVESTESLWSVLNRFTALDRPSHAQWRQVTRLKVSGRDFSALLYRQSLDISLYKTVRQELGLRRRQIEMATLPILPMTYAESRIRYCPRCLERGFHSSVFQIPWVRNCPVHATLLRDTCQHCGQSIQRGLLAEPPSSSIRCGSCFARLGNMLGTGLWPLSKKEQGLFTQLYISYEQAYRRVVGLILHSIDVPLRHWEVMETALTQEPTCQWESTPLGKIDWVQHKERSIPVESARITGRKESLTGDPYAELVAMHKAFRRHMEKTLAYCYRRAMNREKCGHPRDDILNQEDASSYLTWKLFHRFTTGTSVLNGKNTWRRWQKSEYPDFVLWIPQTVTYHSAQLRTVLIKPGMSWAHMPWSWIREHAFATYLLAIRDEAHSIAEALLLYRMEWPLMDSPIEGRLCPTALIASLHANGKLIFSAWRLLRSTSEIDFQCLTAVKSAREISMTRRQIIEKLR